MGSGCKSIKEDSRVLMLSPGGWEEYGRRKSSGIGMWNQEFIFRRVKNGMLIRNQIMIWVSNFILILEMRGGSSLEI